MHNVLFLRSLLASAVAFTLGNSAATQTNCVKHTGSLQVSAGSEYNTVKTFVGYVQPSTSGFGVGPESSQAIFYFTGCQGGDPITLYCSNCDSTGASVVATKSVALDIYNEPTNWWLLNIGENADENDTGGPGVGQISTLFTWGTDDLIHPVAYNTARQPSGILQTGWYDPTSSTEIIFIVTAGPHGGTHDFMWQEL